MIHHNLAIFALLGLLQTRFTIGFFPTHASDIRFSTLEANHWNLNQLNAPHVRLSAFDVVDDDGEEEEAEDEEEEDPYTKIAGSEFADQETKDKSLSTLSGSAIDWGGEYGKLRQRAEGNKDPATALFGLLSSETPNQLIGSFVSTANPKVVKACSDAVNSLLGGLSSPQMGVETIVKTNGEKIGSLCLQLMMTGYLFRNIEYVLALKEMMNIKGSATLQDYKVGIGTELHVT